jgi:hypothetical protein
VRLLLAASLAGAFVLALGGLDSAWRRRQVLDVLDALRARP